MFILPRDMFILLHDMYILPRDKFILPRDMFNSARKSVYSMFVFGDVTCLKFKHHKNKTRKIHQNFLKKLYEKVELRFFQYFNLFLN